MTIEVETFEFVERCRTHRTTDALLADLLHAVRKVGFEHLIVSGVPAGSEELEPLVELNGWPDGWFQRYVERRYADVDGVCRHSRTAIQPFYWQDVPERLSASASSRLVANEATDFGLMSGYVVPSYSRRHWQALVSFASPARQLRLSRRELTAVNLMSMMTVRCVENLRHPDVLEIVLTPREQEILTWAAMDKTADEIADILRISTATVRKHLQNIRRTYGVSSTLGAVAVAMHRAHIAP
ncbi:helix-turn-helix transcriptional regulator [Rhizobium herbae]|uniref:LuxR family quorum sensing-dependent transcriptional regulator n=1 Tax=Rhizobium herbae TaxID=508661 RepID=A0ABS4EKD6_9HYPH|nr:LuxR family transcriptional regulator [Rhizobium herbae]MBP1858404.1 LuxR family quorum sensing-dependent transcriptional regulator [Rhizobium herbae]